MKSKEIFIKKHQENLIILMFKNDILICVYSTIIVRSIHVFAPAASLPVQNLKR